MPALLCGKRFDDEVWNGEEICDTTVVSQENVNDGGIRKKNVGAVVEYVMSKGTFIFIVCTTTIAIFFSLQRTVFSLLLLVLSSI